MIRPQFACRAMWRRANSLIMNAAPIASTANCRVHVAAVTGCRVRPSRSARAGVKVSASHPLALLTRTPTAGLGRVVNPQERTQDRVPLPRQGLRGRGANAVISARHDRGMPSCHHDSLL